MSRSIIARLGAVLTLATVIVSLTVGVAAARPLPPPGAGGPASDRGAGAGAGDLVSVSDGLGSATWILLAGFVVVLVAATTLMAVRRHRRGQLPPLGHPAG